MFFVTLGDKASSDVNGNTLWANYGPSNVGPFKTLNGYYYWTGLEYAPTPNSAWYFNIANGFQGDSGKDLPFGAWVVHPGDIAEAVPEPEAFYLVLAGLGVVLTATFGRQK